MIQVPRGVMVRELRIGTPTCLGTEKEDLADLDKAWGGTTGGQNSITTIIHGHPSVMFSQNFWSNKYMKRCSLTCHKPSKDEGNSCLKVVLASDSDPTIAIQVGESVVVAKGGRGGMGSLAV